jgi:hypothetical protein
MSMPQSPMSPVGAWLYVPTNEAASFWDWAAWAAGEDEVAPPQEEKLPYRIQNTFVTVDKGESAPPPSCKDAAPDTASAESDSTAATEEDQLTRQSDFVHGRPTSCKATRSFTSPDLTGLKGAQKRSSSAPAKVRLNVTLMLRNLPNRAKPQRVEEHLNSLGFTEFTLHLPIDARTGVNKGYCFVRLDESLAAAVCAKVDGTQLGSGSKKKLCAVIAESQDRVIRRAK